MTNLRQTTALVALIAMAAHASALGGGFIWLDHAHLEDGIALAPLFDWPRLFTHGFAGTGFYRPLMSVSLSLDAATGAGPWLYHLTTVAWHAAAAALTVVAAEAFGLSRRAAFAAGVLFAVHPVTSLVTSAIAFRSESMAAVALLSLIILHRRGHAWGAGAVLLAGALTKETALVLGPLFIAALELGSADGASRRRLKLWAHEGAALVAAVGLRFAFAPPWRATFAALSPGEAAGTRLASLAKSAARVFLPIDATVCDAFPVTRATDPRALLGAAVLLGVIYLAWRRRGPALLLAIALVPSLQLVPVMRWWSPHYLYIPFAFAAMLIAEAVEARGTWALRIAGAAAAALTVATLSNDRRFATDESLWSPEVAAEPACREGHFYLAEVAREARRLDEAAAHYEEAIRADPQTMSYVDRLPALQNLGVVRLTQERFDDARAAFRAALAAVVDGDYQRMLTHNLATTELRAGHPAEAAALLEREVARPDALPASIFIRARAVESLGRTDEARLLMRRLENTAPR